MAIRKLSEQNIRKLTRVGGTSLSVTIPVNIVRKLKWKERQKVVVRKAGSGVSVKDWKKGD